MYANADLDNNSGSATNNTNGNSDTQDIVVDQMYAEGPLFGSVSDLGKLHVYSDNTFNTGFMMDDSISGAQFNWKISKNKNANVIANVGRYDFDHAHNTDATKNYAFDGTADFASIEFNYAPKTGLGVLAGYYDLRNIAPRDGVAFSKSQIPTGGTALNTAGNNSGIWVGGLGYTFANNVKLFGVYAKSDLDAVAGYKGDAENKAYDVTLKYGQADMKKAGSWDIYGGYRYLGDAATFHPTYDISARGTKGWHAAIDYTVAQNIITTLEYYKGKTLSADYAGNSSKADYNAIYGRVDFFF